MLGARLVWLNRELEFRKMRVHELWKKGKATQEDYKDVMFAGGKLKEPKPNGYLTVYCCKKNKIIFMNT